MRLSFSQISTYQRCPKQYEFASVKRMPRNISQQESYGSSIHNTLKRWGQLEQTLQQKKEQKQLTLFAQEMPTKDAVLTLETLLLYWEQCFITQTYTKDTQANEAFLQGKNALHHFYTWWKKETRTIVGIEESFNIQINGDEIVGRFDRVEQWKDSLRIIDFKSSSPRSKQVIDEDMQLSIYVKAAQVRWPTMRIGEMMFLFIRPDRTTESTTIRSEKDIARAMQDIRRVKEYIDAKDFTPTPTKQKCQHCPYRHICSSAVLAE